MERTLPSDQARELLTRTRELADRELAPRAALAEQTGAFPREVFRVLGKAGLLGLPYPQRYGGGGQPYEVYLQVVEELASRWLTVALGVSVHTLACFPIAGFGSEEQRSRLLPDLLGGELLGAYCLSEPHAGSDAAALRTSARRRGEDGYVIEGTKAWITHAGVADFYTVFARTGPQRTRGISCFHVPAGQAGPRAARPERKMGLSASPTAQLVFDGVEVGAADRVGEEGQGFSIALAALDAGRLGIAACAVGLAQAALDAAIAFARSRRRHGQPLIESQGTAFLLADMATAVAAARELCLAAARRRDAGLGFTRQAAMAKLLATDTAMRVTADAVQILGDDGYVGDLPVERYLREAKVLQIVEGTNQIQRLVIGRDLAR